MGLLLCVDYFMPAEGTGLSECLAAHLQSVNVPVIFFHSCLALERPSTRVDGHVPCQIVVSAECFGADLALELRAAICQMFTISSNHFYFHFRDFFAQRCAASQSIRGCQNYWTFRSLLAMAFARCFCAHSCWQHCHCCRGCDGLQLFTMYSLCSQPKCPTFKKNAQSHRRI